ncbi:thiamine diphosphokinase [bacterium 1xD8-48]|nr:thiamine diphosphokinase [Lachnospiraceae bacterium]NBJ99031.1 thiamine diphosphokinase [bacterium 1xD8-48]
MGVCYIVGAGEFGDGLPCILSEDILIACDGGYAYCREKNLPMTLVVGDFDSLKYLPEHPDVVKLKPEKDDTDTGWAVKEGWRRGYRDFVIYGGCGGRISHTIANIQLLSWLAAEGGRGVLIGRGSWYCVIKDSEICFGEEEEGYLSVFCLSDRAEGVCETGLKYGLDNAVLTKEYPVGVSNEFTGEKSRVSVGRGTLLLIKEQFHIEFEQGL